MGFFREYTQNYCRTGEAPNDELPPGNRPLHDSLYRGQAHVAGKSGGRAHYALEMTPIVYALLRNGFYNIGPGESLLNMIARTIDVVWTLPIVFRGPNRNSNSIVTC